MFKNDEKRLLFIQPDPASLTSAPVIDKLTRKMMGAWMAREHGMVQSRGFHRCTGCDAESDNRDHFVVTVKGARILTNSLAIHYLALHRAAVPRSDLAIVASLAADEVDVPGKMLKPQWYSSRNRSR